MTQQNKHTPEQIQGFIKEAQSTLKTANRYSAAFDLDHVWESYTALLAEVEALKAENEGLKDDSYKCGFEHGVNSVPSIIEEQAKEVEALKAFKTYVHKRLDDAGIEKNPNGEHSKRGCRIGDRLDIVLDQITEIDSVLELVPENERLKASERELYEALKIGCRRIVFLWSCIEPDKIFDEAHIEQASIKGIVTTALSKYEEQNKPEQV